MKFLGTYWPGLLAVTFWGLSYNWSEICFSYYSPLATITIRLILSSIILFSWLRCTNKKSHIRKADRKWFLATGFFSPFLYFIGENYGLDLTTPTTTAVIIATIPLFVPVAAYFLLKEKLSSLNIFGILVSFGGIMILLVDRSQTVTGSAAGYGLLFLAVTAAVGYSMIIKRLTSSYTPITIIAWQNMIGLTYFLPFFLVLDGNNVMNTPLTFPLAGSLLALAILGSSLAFILFVRVIRDIGVSKTNVLSNLIPVITAIAALVLGQESFGWQKTLGMLVVISGVLLSQAQQGTKILRIGTRYLQ